MSVKVKNYYTNDGRSIGTAYLNIISVDIIVEVWNEAQTELICKEKVSNILGTTQSISASAEALLKKIGKVTTSS